MDRRGEGGGAGHAGLISLGLMMQMVGSMFAAYLVVALLDPLVHRAFASHRGGHFDLYRSGHGWFPGHPRLHAASWQLPIMFCAALVRAVLHRRAGSALLNGRRGGVGALGACVAFALLHARLCWPSSIGARTT